MSDAARNQRTRMKGRPDAEFGRLGLVAILALLVFAAAPGFRLLPGAGPIAGWTAERGSPLPAKAAASVGGDTILGRAPGQATRKGDRAPGAPGAGLIVTAVLLLPARTAIRSGPAVQPVAGGGLRRPYDPRGPPAA